MFSKNVAAFIELVTGDDAAYTPNWDDDIVAESCVARGGRLVHPRLASDPATNKEPT
jgi:hypothetical protein